MALFSHLAEPRGAIAPLLNRRLKRDVAAAAILFVVVTFFVWTHGKGLSRSQKPRRLPKNEMWPAIDKPYQFPTTSEFHPVNMDPGVNSTAEELCSSFPRHMLNSVQPVLKMGYTENREKVNAQLDSVSACFQPGDLLFFSDLDETLRGHQVVDVLAHLPDSYSDRGDKSLSKFQNYLLQKELKANGSLDADPEAKKLIHGWEIDKFKFLPAVERAWIMRPNKDFYVFYETDTYIIWDNLFRLLQFLNPDEVMYIGAPSPGRIDPERDQGTLFANGGPGYVLSRGAMKVLLDRKPGPVGHVTEPPLTEKWRHLLNDGECCGDSVLGFVVFSNNITMQGYYPLFADRMLSSITYDDKHWCHPLITMHKASPQEMPELWKWEFQHRKSGRPLLYADIWGYYKPGTEEKRENWNNEGKYAITLPKDANIESADQCRDRCKSDSKCLQYLWKGRDENSCLLMHGIYYGHAQQPEEHDDGKAVDFTAGWLPDRIAVWRAKRPCEEVLWLGPSLERDRWD